MNFGSGDDITIDDEGNFVADEGCCGLRHGGGAVRCELNEEAWFFIGVGAEVEEAFFLQSRFANGGDVGGGDEGRGFEIERVASCGIGGFDGGGVCGGGEGVDFELRARDERNGAVRGGAAGDEEGDEEQV